MNGQKITQFVRQGVWIVILLFAGTQLGEAKDLFPGKFAGPEEPKTPSDSVSSSFTYQGRLEESGLGVNDTCDFRFSLYDHPTAGSPIGSTQTVNSVPVSEGYFNVELNEANQFGTEAFHGEARYLEIEVQCSGDAVFVPLTGGTPKRVALDATPYAHSLRPGAEIDGSSSDATLGGAVLNVFNDALDPVSAAVYAISEDEDIATWGLPDAPVGVFGGSPTGFGVMGRSTKNTGVFGDSTSGYGLYGSSLDGYALYTDGKAHIEGKLTWKAVTSAVSVSAAAFRPEDNTMDFFNHGYRLGDYSGMGSWNYYAPVQIPHEAVIIDMTCYWNDIVPSRDLICRLVRTPMDGTDTVLITAQSTGWSGDGSTTEICSANCQVDNTRYAYYLNWLLDAEGLMGYGVVITYEISTPY